MIRIKVQYDASSRTFRLVDHDFKTLLEGDALYDLNIPLMYEEEAEVEEFIPPGSTFVSHA
jgi:broad specificity polyphosphatase/5'/3'-nucleotidase SurE